MNKLFLLGFIVQLLKSAFSGAESDFQFVKFGVPEVETSLTSEDFLSRPPTVDPSRVDENILYQPDLFEGDILGLTDETLDEFLKQANAYESLREFVRKFENNVRYQAIRDESRLWLDGVVPYTVSSLYTRKGRAQIARAITIVGNNTCLRFIPKTVEEDYLFLTPKGGGCSSFVGRQRGRQIVQVGADCLDLIGIILHELMHALGFFHEQSRSDRDQHVEVVWDNIASVYTSNFRKYELDYISHLGMAYDYGSVMHYGPYAFSKNGRQTLRAFEPMYESVMGQRTHFSPVDIIKINKLYGCSKDVSQVIDQFTPRFTTTARSTTTLPLTTTYRYIPTLPPRWRRLSSTTQQTTTTTTTTTSSTSTTATTTTNTKITPSIRSAGPQGQETTIHPSGPGTPDSLQGKVLYHPYECYVKEDHGKMMYWPSAGYPRSEYRCIISDDPESWRGYRYAVRRMSCTWRFRGAECTVPRGQSYRCWNRFRMTCPDHE